MNELLPHSKVRYRFRFSAPVVALLAAGIALAAAGFALTTWQFVGFLQGDLSSALEWLKYAVLYIVSVGIAIVLTAMLVRSQYILTETSLIVAFGFIRMRYPLDAIRSVHHFRGAGKLAVYFDGEKTKYIVVVIRPAEYDAFVRALLSRGEHIGFSFSTAEEEDAFKKKK